MQLPLCLFADILLYRRVMVRSEHIVFSVLETYHVWHNIVDAWG